MSKFIEERCIEKSNGKRISTNTQFLKLAHKQTQYVKPKMSCWGWRDKRNNSTKSGNIIGLPAV